MYEKLFVFGPNVLIQRKYAQGFLTNRSVNFILFGLTLTHSLSLSDPKNIYTKYSIEELIS
jgi:hypothetical protein